MVEIQFEFLRAVTNGLGALDLNLNSGTSCRSTMNYISIIDCRGFPCGLWTLFHLLTTQSVRLDYDYRIVPNIIFDYVTTVFSCRVCGDNFIMEENIFQIHELTSNKDSVIWLWKLHNKVNERLQGKIFFISTL